MTEAASPAMAQWFALKAGHEDALLFFRMGDFYELFFDDAQAASAALDIALTARGQHQGAPIPMCGVPVSQSELYLTRLIKRGFRVAVVEQMEDPAAAKARGAKGPLKREIVRLVTPGTITEDALLDAARANFCAAIVAHQGAFGVAWADISTGLFETDAVTEAGLPALLGRLDAAEIIAPEAVELGAFAARRAATSRLAMPNLPSPAAARRLVAQDFGAASVAAFGDFADAEMLAAAQLLGYLRATQMGAMPRLSRPASASRRGQLIMDAATRISLDILSTRQGAEAGSLFGTIRRTVTAGGARLLADWLSRPLNDLTVLQARQAAWVTLRDTKLAEPIRAALRGTPDMARALSRLALNRASPRDLASLRAGLEAGSRIAPMLPAGFVLVSPAMLLTAPALRETLARALAEPAPARFEDGGAIAPGFDGELDAHRRLRDETRNVIAAFQLELATRAGVASLKIRHHAQLGYIAEVPAAAAEKLRDNPDFTLRQGMANGARFTHPELSALDQRINEAAAAAQTREAYVFTWLTRQVLAEADVLAACADALALLDVLAAAASLAANGRWQCPALSDDEAYEVTGGRHPVVEAALPPGVSFIENDCDLPPNARLMLLTGPNMAGKSTFLRQNALLVILAQAGLPVPARAMRLGLVDRLFSRVGAADDLAAGRSTFMVEMTETAAILHQAGPKSFVIVDEIGRGTGTRDGLAIAQAVLEALHNSQRCRAIFATHFHELSGVAEFLPRAKPCTMRVKAYRGEVVFMHEVVEGAAQRSWGVHVARLAGVPEPVAKRAEALLKAAEREAAAANTLPLFAGAPEAEPQPEDELIAALDMLAPDQMSPREALDALYALQARLAARRAL